MGDDPMSQHLYPSRSPRIAARKLGSEMMIMSGSDSTLFTLNETATLIWEAADGHSTLEEIVSGTICSRFDVEYNDALSDAVAIAEQLASHGILFFAVEQTTTQGESIRVNG
jgi:hypothetical protein